MAEKTLDDIYNALSTMNDQNAHNAAVLHQDNVNLLAALQKNSSPSDASGMNIGLGEDGKVSATVHFKF